MDSTGNSAYLLSIPAACHLEKYSEVGCHSGETHIPINIKHITPTYIGFPMILLKYNKILLFIIMPNYSINVYGLVL